MVEIVRKPNITKVGKCDKYKTLREVSELVD